jgi:hypothetical protein
MITTEQFNEMQARVAAGRHQSEPVGPDAVTDEGDLHDQILSECKRRLWPAVHSRMDMATTTARGCPDFVIFADAGRVFAIECKTAKGKLTPEQMGWKMLLERNGHRYALVRSFEDFLGVIETWLNQ